ncbi:probable ATP-dependent RNA helicase DDX52 [Macrobrachium nipponense]|uniref:probable ATP-dependent RNA helicase DDX52 n=1 Tax=Macrobrachium nipponense TaxID=159736 RepID=UPI0030C83881
MNSYDIFRKLTRGINFNQKRFKGELHRIGVISRHEKDIEVGEAEVLSNEDSKVNEIKSEEGGTSLAEGNTDVDFNGGVKILGDLHFSKELSKSKRKKKRKKELADGETEEQREKQRLLELKTEQINRARNQNGIHVWGTDIPGPILFLDELKTEYNVAEVIVDNLRNQGFVEPMPIQMQAWSLMLQGREILASAPTGSGKTAAFLVPILHQLEGPRKKGFRAVLLAPTRELAKQTHRECVRLSEGLGFRAHIISNVNRAKKKFGPNSSKKFDISCNNPPKRLVFLLQDGDTPSVDLSNVEWLVIDESDRLFEGGVSGFRDQLAIIYQACTNSNIRRALFSATFAYEVQEWCKLNLNNVAMVSIGNRNTASGDVKQELLFCGAEHGKLVALRDILRKGYKPPVLVFVQTKERAKELFRELIYENIMVDAIHADRTQTQRDNVVRAFRERKIWVLICTELMARGIDFKGVNLVINYDFPPSVISYIHRVGRTGRAQHKGRAITFWTLEDKPNLQSIAQVIHNSKQEVPEWMLTLKKLSKRQKQQQQQNIPERGHISAYDVYREQSRIQEKIKQKRLFKLQKRAAKAAAAVMEGETGETTMSLEDGEVSTVDDIPSSDIKPQGKKRKNKGSGLGNPKKKKKLGQNNQNPNKKKKLGQNKVIGSKLSNSKKKKKIWTKTNQ